ncbi:MULTISPECIES: hypothetical protein [Cryobacterium]|uniref:hypothetical protein n=1 Tax=Cryobacterium TaxID=69578 RepID=UPI000CD40D93|nr:MULTISPECIES: hypothetical protein [Cryobacterium]POH65623.1 hypothetical protein C3B60_12125 [Cryobacterium zongtaii]TFC45323.1 hypothetical protein E3O57_09460 [Cryobacterium sp. TMN-39-2]TFC88598.1 hypothetical protein E3T19_10170 [Cryobacterium sp. TMT4-31]
MTPPIARWRYAANGAALLAVLSVASVVLHTTPNRELQHSPMVVAATLAEPASGRDIRATVHSVAITEAVTAGNGWAGSTPGVWVVVELSVEAVVEDRDRTLGTAVLRVGDTEYSASTRPGTATLVSGRPATGIPLTGPLMFELPADVVSAPAAERATLELARNSDPRVDSLLVMPVDLAALDVRPSIDVDLPHWGVR